MKKWVLAFGPDEDAALAAAMEHAKDLNAAQVTVGQVGEVHTDKVQAGSVHIVLVWSTQRRTVMVDETVSQKMVLVLGQDAKERIEQAAVRFKSQGLNVVAVTAKGVTHHADKPDVVLIEYESDDMEVRSITFDFEAYYGWVKSSKFSRGILGGKDL